MHSSFQYLSNLSDHDATARGKFSGMSTAELHPCEAAARWHLLHQKCRLQRPSVSMDAADCAICICCRDSTGDGIPVASANHNATDAGHQGAHEPSSCMHCNINIPKQDSVGLLEHDGHKLSTRDSIACPICRLPRQRR